MPTTQFSEIALQRRKEKQRYVLEFPGRLAGWAQAPGKTVETVVEAACGSVVLFTDGTFVVTATPIEGTEPLLEALQAARDCLGRHHAGALTELDHRISAEREAMRLARVEKVVGAVETNLTNSPELREQLAKLLGAADGSVLASEE
jgi:hypothetical protein